MLMATCQRVACRAALRAGAGRAGPSPAAAAAASGTPCPQRNVGRTPCATRRDAACISLRPATTCHARTLRTFPPIAAVAMDDGYVGDGASGTVWVTFELQGDAAELMADELMSCGALSTMVEDPKKGAGAGAGEQEIYHAKKGGADWYASVQGTEGVKTWERSLVKVLFPTGMDLDEALGEAAMVCGIPIPDYELGEAKTADWVEEVAGYMRDTFHGSEIAEGFWVVPQWEPVPEGRGGINIVLEPGIAFGTGDHPTTRLCLQWLQKNIRGGETVLDYGVGSGILAIGALLLGASTASGVDIDVMSISATRQNVALNRLEGRVEALMHTGGEEDPLPCAPGGEPGVFDVLVANILQGPLIDLEPRLASYVKPGGRMALSGVLMSQSEAVVAAYSRSFRDMEVTGCPAGEWACISGVRK